MGAILKNMSEMGVTASTENLRAMHPVAIVRLAADILGIRWLKEARPTCTRIKFFLGLKQLQTAAHATIQALIMMIPESAGTTPFRSFQTCYGKLLRC